MIIRIVGYRVHLPMQRANSERNEPARMRVNVGTCRECAAWFGWKTCSIDFMEIALACVFIITNKKVLPIFITMVSYCLLSFFHPGGEHEQNSKIDL